MAQVQLLGGLPEDFARKRGEVEVTVLVKGISEGENR